MCGVFGIIGDYSPAKARAALSLLEHRGRDYCGIVESERLFLAHHRLSIVDSHERSHQPMREGDLILSFNGEIYNHAALRKELGMEGWKTQSDAEVILKAYMRWGIACVERFEGMFAFALLDRDKLYLVRDRFGKKPIFFLQQDGQFYFASEIKALKPFLKQVRMNEEAMESYLRFLAPVPPHTFYEGISKLESGEWLCFEDGKVTKHSHYDLTRARRDFSIQENDIHRLLEESVFKRLPSDIPTAALLSGGIDSAMISAVAARQGRKLHTFTLGYDEYGNYDERGAAAETAEELGLLHTEIILTRRDFEEHLDDVLKQFDEPLNDPAALPLYWLLKHVAEQGYKVVFSGEGADEIFLGYRQYFEYLDIEKASTLHHKNWLKKYFHSNFSMNREWEWYKRIFDETLLFRTSGEKFTDLQLNRLMRKNIKDNDSLLLLQKYRETFENSQYSDPGHWYSYIDLKLFVGEHFLAKLDRMSMVHTLEARTPFLDHSLIEAVYGADPSLRIGEGGTKSLLKSIGTKYLSPKILQRKKKGFSNPYLEWLYASKRISLIREINQQTGIFHDEVLEKYIEMGGRGRFKQHVWGLYLLSHWIERELL